MTNWHDVNEVPSMRASLGDLYLRRLTVFLNIISSVLTAAKA